MHGTRRRAHLAPVDVNVWRRLPRSAQRSMMPPGNCVALSQVLHGGFNGISRPMQSAQPPSWHGTTILTVRKGGVVAIGGDGQVSIGQTIVKSNAKKVRRLGKGDVIGGF